MPAWSKIAVGLVIAIVLLGFAGLKAYTDRIGPAVQTGTLVQEHGTTYYGDGPEAPPVACKSESEIRSAIDRVHAEYDLYDGAQLEAFEQRAAHLKGLPPLRVDKLYVITKDDNVRDRESVLFIGLKGNCVSIVFGFPARLYAELAAAKDV